MTTYDPPARPLTQTIPPRRLLLGPGPSEVHPEVLRAMTMPPLGHLDPAMMQIMGEVQELLRYAFQTRNRFTLALSGTGTSGMEAALVNTIEPGDDVLVGVIGYFGERLCQVAARAGGQVSRIEAEWGKTLDPQQVREAIQRARPQVVCMVHAETSTGVCQELVEIAKATHDAGALLVIDAVTSLGGQPLYVDDWGIDVCYSGSQKCLGAPSGLSPITMNEQALDKARNRANPIQSFYLDATLLDKYWNEGQYHHTISAPLIYALRTALGLLREEGLDRRWSRHRLNHQAFRAGCEAMGLTFLPEESVSLWPLNAVNVPTGLDEAAIRSAMLDRFGIEIGGGLGPLKGKLLRIGLMGYGSQQQFVLQLLASLESALAEQSRKTPAGSGLARAMQVYRQGTG